MKKICQTLILVNLKEAVKVCEKNHIYFKKMIRAIIHIIKLCYNSILVL